VIWQNLVSDRGFVDQAVKRFVRKLRGLQRPEAPIVFPTTAEKLAATMPGTVDQIGEDRAGGRLEWWEMSTIAFGTSR